VGPAGFEPASSVTNDRLLQVKPAPGTAVRGPVQPARQPGRANLGGAEELRGQHRRELARPPVADPRLFRSR